MHGSKGKESGSELTGAWMWRMVGWGLGTCAPGLGEATKGRRKAGNPKNASSKVANEAPRPDCFAQRLAKS